MTRSAQKVLQDVPDLPERDRFYWEASWLAELDRREQTDAAEPTPDEEWPAVRARILTGKR